MPLPTVKQSELGIPRGWTERLYMQPGEQDVLLELIRREQPRAMVEIGVNIGLTARAVLQNVPSIQQYVGIDVDRDYRFELPAQQIERPNWPGVLVKDDSRFELVLRPQPIVLRYPCGVVFIDGDHGRDTVRNDSILAAEWTTSGGLIIFHDYGNPTVQVTEVLDELQASGRDIISIEGTWLAFENR